MYHAMFRIYKATEDAVIPPSKYAGTCCLALFLFFAACAQASAASAVPDAPAFPVPSQEGKWGYLQDAATGRILFGPNFSGFEGHTASPDMSIVPAPDTEGAWGYVDAATGKVVIAPQFYQAGFFYDNIAIVSRAYPEKAYEARAHDHLGKVSPAVVVPTAEGLIDRSGREILPALYDLKRADSHGRYIPRLFLLQDAQGVAAVFHTDKGYVVPPGACSAFSFDPDGGVFCGGGYYEPDGRWHAPPPGSVITRLDPETGCFHATQKKENAPDLEGVLRRGGSLLIPVKYHNIKAVPAAGVWLASRMDAAAVAAMTAMLLKGGTPGSNEDKDVLTVDVYDADSVVLRSFRARYYPDVSGEQYSYQSKGRKHEVNARTGAAVPERALPADPTSAFLPFRENGKYGIKNADGTVSVQALYDGLNSLGGGLFAVTRNRVTYTDNWGVIDGSGQEIIPCIYGGIEAASYPTRSTGPLHCMRFSAPEGYWLLGRDGRFITPEDRPYAYNFHFNAVGLAKIFSRHDGKYGVIDHTGKEVIPAAYSDMFDALSLSESKKRRGAGRGKPTDSAGTAKLTAKDSLFLVQRGKLWGLYDGTGKELIPIQYGHISLDDQDLEQDWATVRDEGRDTRGIVNFRTGQAIAPIYNSVRVYPGFFLAYIRGSRTENGQDISIMLDRQGKETARYDRTEWLEDAGILAVRTERDAPYALLDGSGKQIRAARCEYVWQAAASFVWCRTNTEKFLMDNTGKEYRIQSGR